MTTKWSETQKLANGQAELTKVALQDYRKVVEKLFSPRLNLRTQQIEINGIPITEEEFNNFHIKAAEDHGLGFTKENLQSQIRSSARLAAYDPVAEWLNGLGVEGAPILTDEEWDQIAVLALGLGDSYSRNVLQKMLLSAAARVLEPGCKVDQCMILYGPQGLGKSTFFAAVAGDSFSDSMGDLKDKKDDILILHRNWFNEWSEADQVFVGANKSEQIKRFVSTQEDTFRAPYGRTTQAFKRRSILCGTTNRDDWANDPTGNRRFPVLSPTKIDVEWTQENRERIWAYVVVLLRKGARWWFSKEEEEEISAQTANFRPEDPHADACLEQMKCVPNRWFSTQELGMLALGWDKEQVNKKNLNALARSLHAISDPHCVSERRTHQPVNSSHGLKGTRRVFAYIPESTQSTQ